MNAALAVHGDYAYVGSRTDGTHPDSGILVVDISNPEARRWSRRSVRPRRPIRARASASCASGPTTTCSWS